jgi:glycosyltransferase involved in cell wall biosynthesis
VRLERWGRHSCLPRPRFVLTLDDLSAYRFSCREARTLRRLLRRLDALVVASDSEFGALQRLDRRLAQRARLIHFSAAVRPITADFDLARKRRSLGLRAETAVIGVFSPAILGLGLETVIAAAATINRDFPNVEFLFIGDGPDQPDLLLRAHELGVGGAVVFRGTRADIPEIIASLNILVIPREVSGALAYALQALSQEIPVVAVRTPALEEIIGPVDPAAFIPPDDPAALAVALARRLEILPPPQLAEFSEFGFSYGDMIVSSAGFDLDAVGLEAQYRGDESVMQQAVRQAREKYGPRRTVQAIRQVYEEVLA